MYLFLMGLSVNPPVGRTLVDMICLPVFLMQKPAILLGTAKYDKIVVAGEPAINKTGC